ncbi:hypothetical protein CPA46_02820 [Sphingopyxis terrae subsp. ummariensis]|nr:hypothetical protein CPA46_02820 [Sphingopyxis terrae subsp. ummariensis]
MEARFLADIKAKLLDNFDSGPSAALGDATAALRSELKQLGNLADQEPAIFEECWTVLDRMKNTNRFVAALFRNIQRKGHASGAKYQTGAALIYQTRCAIVHAGEKDMIFESFDDAEAALEAVLPSVERASLLLVGIELL